MSPVGLITTSPAVPHVPSGTEATGRHYHASGLMLLKNCCPHRNFSGAL